MNPVIKKQLDKVEDSLVEVIQFHGGLEVIKNADDQIAQVILKHYAETKALLVMLRAEKKDI